MDLLIKLDIKEFCTTFCFVFTFGLLHYKLKQNIAGSKNFFTLISPMIQMFFGPDALDSLRSDSKTKKLENWVCGRSDNDLHSFRSDRSLTY